ATVMAYIKRLNLRLDQSGPKLSPDERTRQLERLANLNGKLYQLVVKAARNGDLDRTDAGVAFTEKMNPEWTRYACSVTGDMRSLIEALKYQAVHGTDTERAKSLLARLETSLKKAHP
ncbi:MAG TPA: hypothetical protein PLY73_05670, partial [Candidatus Ozemobacteraceae bacterium]|nr:hypothetical protein [Candidatus Ozemobacteraceae bacterium]